MNKPLFLFVFNFLAPSFAWAAACCGGGFAAPSVIVGDDRAQITASYQLTQIKKDVYPDGIWNNRDFRESSETLKIEGAHIFLDRWQAGFTLPVVRRLRQSKEAAGLGDIAATLGYEYLPDWDYSPWRPKGLGYLQLTAPTGRSIYQADGPFQLDARGRGFWALGAGTLLTKIIGRFDVFGNLDAHHSFERDDLKPGWGGNLGLGAGYNWSDWRFGAGLTWTYEDPIDVKNSSNGSAERYATAALSASYMFADEWAATATVSDQTLFGEPVNARLGQAVMLQAQRRWGR